MREGKEKRVKETGGFMRAEEENLTEYLKRAETKAGVATQKKQKKQILWPIWEYQVELNQ